MTNWEIHGVMFGNCNCSYGCPCQFDALPTHGHCKALIFARIDKGEHGDVRLDGVKFAFAASWPGAVHEGKGTSQPFIDKSATEAQRDAAFRILTGQDTEEMATAFWVYSQMCDTIHEPIFADIQIDVDIDARIARCEVKGFASSRGEPIRNPVTGEEHQVAILQKNGFEYEQAEIGRGWSEVTGRVPLKLEDSFGEWCELHMNQSGLIRQRAARIAA